MKIGEIIKAKAVPVYKQVNKLSFIEYLGKYNELFCLDCFGLRGKLTGYTKE